MDRRAQFAASDTRPSRELIALALAEPDEDARWNLIAILHARGGEEEFAAAAALCADASAAARALGADVLGQLGWSDRTFLAESVPILLRLLDDSSLDVVYSAATALGHRGDAAAIPALCALARHPDEDLRFAAAYSLGGHDDPAAIATLIALVTDPATEVRSWAAFGLGSLNEADTPELRAALAAAAQDSDAEVRGEALQGLARRGDSAATGLVARELAGEFCGAWAIEAAALLRQPGLLPQLSALRGRWSAEDEAAFGQQMDAALAACEAGAQPENPP